MRVSWNRRVRWPRVFAVKVLSDSDTKNHRLAMVFLCPEKAELVADLLSGYLLQWQHQHQNTHKRVVDVVHFL